MTAFAIVWAGQLVSLLGSAIRAIATFALTPYREPDRLCWDGAR